MKKMALYFCLALFLTTGYTKIMAQENYKQNQYEGFAFTTGVGPIYGGMAGATGEYYFTFPKSQNLGLIAGVGVFSEIGYAGTVRYAYGLGDRFICDFTYGKVGEKEEWDQYYDEEIHEWVETDNHMEAVYDPSIGLGYQRITDFGFTCVIEGHISYHKDKDYIEGVPILIGFTVGIGYKF